MGPWPVALCDPWLPKSSLTRHLKGRTSSDHLPEKLLFGLLKLNLPCLVLGDVKGVDEHGGLGRCGVLHVTNTGVP